MSILQDMQVKIVMQKKYKKVLKKLKGNDEREANFRTVIALILDGKNTFFEGHCRGSITNTQVE